MIIQKADLFKDVLRPTMDEIAKIMVEQSYEKGAVLFQAGQPATHFYVLVDGRVRLTLGTEAQIDYTATVPGEAFGWSGMVDRPAYMATAECVTTCKLAKVEKAGLESILEKDPMSGVRFYKRLAAAVVQRLVYNYEAFLSAGSLTGVTSYGTGQVTATSED